MLKNKTLHIVQEASYNGATIYAYRLCTNLKECDQKMISCFNGNAFDEICSKIDCEYLINSCDVGYKYLLLKYWRFTQFLRKKNYNIIHYHQGGVGILFLAYLFRKKAVIVHHLHSGNLIGDNAKKNISIVHCTILKYLSNRTYQLAVAEHVFTEYSEKIRSTKNLKLIKNSTPYVFEQKTKKSNAIGFIGRFTQEKGFSFLLELSVELKKDFPGLRILLMGEDPKLFKTHFDVLQTNIKILNPQLDTEGLYRSIDLLFFLSTAMEGKPLVVLEAISFDVGVIAFSSPALKEILGNDYPLFIKEKNEIMKFLSLYYQNKIDLDKLSVIHKNISTNHNENEMFSKIRKLYTGIVDKP